MLIRLTFAGLLFLTMQYSFAESNMTQLNNLRVAFFEASYDYALIPKAQEALDGYMEINSTKLAYTGAISALKASIGWNPLAQLKSLKTGLRTINKAVEINPNNVEVRFIRFAVLHFTPSFLGYGNVMERDRLFVLSHMDQMRGLSVQKDFAYDLFDFWKDTGRFDHEELKNITAKLALMYP